MLLIPILHFTVGTFQLDATVAPTNITISSVNSMSFPIDNANGSVFFRLIYP